MYILLFAVSDLTSSSIALSALHEGIILDGSSNYRGQRLYVKGWEDPIRPKKREYDQKAGLAMISRNMSYSTYVVFVCIVGQKFLSFTC